MRTQFVLSSFAMIVLLMSGTALAESTQQFNKILLTPYVVNSLVANVNQTFTVSVMPSDGISSVKTALVGVEVYMTPTVTFTIYANDQKCNTPNFTISTTFASASQGSISFDCTNVINKAGNYVIKIKSSQPTSSLFSWLDITYQNAPVQLSSVFNATKSKMTFGGTEYYQGDNKGTVFLQLSNSDNDPISNASCLLTVYNSFQASPIHSVLFSSVSMLQLSDGLYYFDFNIPNSTGVYPVTATCYYNTNPRFFYPAVESDSLCNDKVLFSTVVAGTQIAGTDIYMNSYEDFQYIRIDSTAGASKMVDVNFRWNDTSNACKLDKTVITELDLLYAGSSSNAGLVANFFLFNFTSNRFVKLSNTLTQAGIISGTTPVGFDDFMSNHVTNASDFIASNGTVLAKINMSAGVTYSWLPNWVTIRAIENTSNLVGNIRGGGEIHVNPSFLTNSSNNVNVNLTQFNDTLSTFTNENRLALSGTEYTSGDSARVTAQFLKVTGGNPTPVNDANCNITIRFPNNTVFVTNQTMAYITSSNGIYSYSFVTPATEGVYVSDAKCVKSSTDVFAHDTFHVSDSVIRNISSLNTTVTNLITSVPANVWSFANRTLTEFNFNVSLAQTTINSIVNAMFSNFTYTNSLIESVNTTINSKNFTVVNNVTVNVTVNSSTVNVTVINQSVDFTPITDSIKQHDIGMDNNFTYLFPNISTILSNTNNIGQQVWTYPTRTLTEINLSNVTLTGNITVAFPSSTIDDIARRVYEFFYRAGAVE